MVPDKCIGHTHMPCIARYHNIALLFPAKAKRFGKWAMTENKMIKFVAKYDDELCYTNICG